MHTGQIDATSTNITTSFSTSVKIGPVPSGRWLYVLNGEDTAVWVTVGDSSTTAPSSSLSTNPAQFLVPASSSSPGIILENLTGNRSYVYVRSDSGTLSTAKVTITII